jgi:hypothetical protein
MDPATAAENETLDLTDASRVASASDVAVLAKQMFGDSVIGDVTKSTFVAHLSQLNLSLPALKEVFWGKFGQFIAAERARDAAPASAKSSKPGFVPTCPCPRMYTCNFGLPVHEYKGTFTLTDSVVSYLYPDTLSEPMLERALMRATANINNQVTTMYKHTPGSRIERFSVTVTVVNSSLIHCSYNCSSQFSVHNYLTSFLRTMTSDRF